MDAEEGRRKLMTLTNCRSTMYIQCVPHIHVLAKKNSEGKMFRTYFKYKAIPDYIQPLEGALDEYNILVFNFLDIILQ